jgi:RimJ/RimL family protein N-acetyltransferase
MFKPQLITLQRCGLRIEPMIDADIPALVSLAEANRAELVYMNGTQRLDWYREGLSEQRAGRALPLVIRLGEQLVGTTRFADFVSSLPAAEIGWTWLDRRQHGTGLNSMIKYLML